MPDRDYYLRNDEKFAAIRKAYTDYIAQLFTLARQKDPRGAASAFWRWKRRWRKRSGIARATAIATPPTTR